MAKYGTKLHIIGTTYKATGAGNNETIKTKKRSVAYYDCGGGSRTGVKLETGYIDGQKVVVVNNSDAAETITFATDATSLVAGGTAVIIGQNESKTFTWSKTLGRWIPESMISVADIPNDTVTYAKLQNVSATDRLLGRDTAAAGDAEELTVGGGIEFTGSGGIQTSAFTGDVTKSAGGTATTIANDAVTYAKMQNVSATNRLLGRSTAGAGDVEEITVGGDLSQSGSNFTIGAAAVTNSKIDPYVTQYVDVTIANAALKTLNATPVQVVASPGANKGLVFLGASIKYDFDTAGFDAVGAGDDLTIKYTDAAGAIVGQVETVGFLDGVADAWRYMYPGDGTVARTEATPVAAAALVAHILVGEIFGAAGGGALNIRVYYRVIDMA